MAGTERVLFLDADGRVSAVAAALLQDRVDDHEAIAAAIDPADGIDLPEGVDAVTVRPVAEIDATVVPHIVTIGSAAKDACPVVSPGTHYLHWVVDPDADDLVEQVAELVATSFGGETTYTPVGDLPEDWS